MRLLLVGLGVLGLLMVASVVSMTRGGSPLPFDLPQELVLLAIALAGMTVGFLWIRKIANDVGKV